MANNIKGRIEKKTVDINKTLKDHLTPHLQRKILSLKNPLRREKETERDRDRQRETERQKGRQTEGER